MAVQPLGTPAGHDQLAACLRKTVGTRLTYPRCGARDENNVAGEAQSRVEGGHNLLYQPFEGDSTQVLGLPTRRVASRRNMISAL